MRENSAASDLFLPSLVLASALHAAMIFGVRVDLVEHSSAGSESLEVSLMPSIAEVPRQLVPLPTEQERLQGREALNPEPLAETPLDRGLSAPTEQGDSKRMIDSGTATADGDLSVTGAAGFVERKIRARTRLRPAPARRDGSETVQAAGSASPRLEYGDSAASNDPKKSGTVAGSQQSGFATTSDTPSQRGQSLKHEEGVGQSLSSLREESIAAHEPARLTAAALGRQASEWSAEYTMTPEPEPVQPPRTAYVEKVGPHRVAAAAYEHAWQDKVERVGNMNYPEEARRKNLTGGLMLSVGVNADGSINGIQVRRSSGHEELDQAAIRIVRLAAPFSAFPSELKKDYDVLWITRTWRFFIDNHLATTP